MNNMKRYSKAFALSITLTMVCSFLACNSGNKKKDMEFVKITKKEIISQFKAKPDASINFAEASMHFEKYPERWNEAFRFLIESDLKNLPVGRLDLNDNVYVTVSEYETKNPEEAKFESHKKYIDMQYLVSGEELIGHTNPRGLEIISPYSEEKDIIFYEYDGGELLKASPSNYFLFFPDDAHRPCLDPDDKSTVKKIVVKIKYD